MQRKGDDLLGGEKKDLNLLQPQLSIDPNYPHGKPVQSPPDQRNLWIYVKSVRYNNVWACLPVLRTALAQFPAGSWGKDIWDIASQIWLQVQYSWNQQKLRNRRKIRLVIICIVPKQQALAGPYLKNWTQIRATTIRVICSSNHLWKSRIKEEILLCRHFIIELGLRNPKRQLRSILDCLVGKNRYVLVYV